MGLITSVLGFCVVVAIFTVILTVQYISNEGLEANNIYMFNTAYSIKCAMITIWTFGIITGILLIMDIHLVLLHLWLIKHNLTTYEYILFRNKKQNKTSQVK